MARVNVDDCFWGDPRIQLLATLTKEHHLLLRGRLIQVWAGLIRNVTDVTTSEEIDLYAEWDNSGGSFAPFLVKAGLAEELTGGTYRIRGIQDRIGYLEKKALSGKLGGKKSAEVRRRLFGTAQPGKNNEVTDTESYPDTSRSIVEAAESMPKPLGTTQSNSTNRDMRNGPKDADFDELYSEHYPLKEGKTKGIKKCRAAIKTWEDFDRLEMAVRNYSARYKRPQKHGEFRPEPKHFDTFMGCWQDFLDPETGTRAISGQSSSSRCPTDLPGEVEIARTRAQRDESERISAAQTPEERARILSQVRIAKERFGLTHLLSSASKVDGN